MTVKQPPIWTARRDVDRYISNLADKALEALATAEDNAMAQDELEKELNRIETAIEAFRGGPSIPSGNTYGPIAEALRQIRTRAEAYHPTTEMT